MFLRFASGPGSVSFGHKLFLGSPNSKALSAGFIVNRLLMPMVNEAFFALMEGVGTAADIDRAMHLGTNQPMGPLALADFVGALPCTSQLSQSVSGRRVLPS